MAERAMNTSNGGKKMYTILILSNKDNRVVKRYKNVGSHIHDSFYHFLEMKIGWHTETYLMGEDEYLAFQPQ